MAKYLIAVLDHESSSGTDEEMAAVDEFNEYLVTNEHWVFAGGLADPSSSKVIDNRGTQPLIQLGPHVVSEEFMSGFWIIDAPNDDVAVDLAHEGSRCCNRKVELRRLL